jgi:hypothetical protein
MVNESDSTLSPPVMRSPKKGKSAAKPRTEAVAKPPASIGLIERSVFHEHWWLDAATGGDWELALVKNGDEVIGEMPYTLKKKGPWQVSMLPPLTRTLGPVIKPKPKGAGEQEWCHRLSVAKELTSQIQHCASFHQMMDPRISEAEAIAFSLQGFNVSVSYTLKMSPGTDESDVWTGLRRNTRNWIRRAAERLTVQEIPDADVFVDFYDFNLTTRKRTNEYGSATMRRVLMEVVRRKAGVLLGAYGEDGSLAAATALVWDNSIVYYLLSSRRIDAHGGAVSVLLWHAMRAARERNLVFDFDGVSNAGILEFLGGFGGELVQRFEVWRTRRDYAALRTVLRGARAVLSSPE